MLPDAIVEGLFLVKAFTIGPFKRDWQMFMRKSGLVAYVWLKGGKIVGTGWLLHSS